MDNRQHVIPAASIDAAVIRLAELAAFANLLSIEEAAGAFGQLDLLEQVSIFGALEGMANAARSALAQGAEVAHGYPPTRAGEWARLRRFTALIRPAPL